MANTKTYMVVKDGSPIKELKSLTAAKKLADAEGAEVLCDGECVYLGTVAAFENAVPELSDAAPEETVTEAAKPERYTLTAKMNIRRAPSLEAQKLGIAQPGTVVEVAAIENDWLRLTDGTFILYEGGRFAWKN